MTLHILQPPHLFPHKVGDEAFCASCPGRTSLRTAFGAATWPQCVAFPGSPLSHASPAASRLWPLIARAPRVDRMLTSPPPIHASEPNHAVMAFRGWAFGR